MIFVHRDLANTRSTYANVMEVNFIIQFNTGLKRLSRDVHSVQGYLSNCTPNDLRLD